MRKILIISDSHGNSIKESVECYFGHKNINIFPHKFKKIENYSTWLTPFEIDDLHIEVLILDGRSAFNFLKYINLLKNTNYDNYKIYVYLGYNDLVPLKYHNNEKDAALKYVENVKTLFKNNVTIIFPLLSKELIKKDKEYENVYKKYIYYIKKYCELYEIKYKDIYDFVEKNIPLHDWKDADHLHPHKYFSFIKWIENI